jgi:hypothetical protein
VFKDCGWSEATAAKTDETTKAKRTCLIGLFSQKDPHRAAAGRQLNGISAVLWLRDRRAGIETRWATGGNSREIIEARPGIAGWENYTTSTCKSKKSEERKLFAQLNCSGVRVLRACVW